MGMSADSACDKSHPQAQANQAFLDAPLRLQAESYEGFARFLPSLSKEFESSESVKEELRRLQIDPEVFYRKHKRLEVSKFSADDLDPGVPSASASSSGQELAGAFSPEVVEASASADFAPPPRTLDKSKVIPSKLSSLNVPCSDEVEDLPYEEIDLDAEGETRGGRLGHATPKGLEGRLQVDSLTDDGDEDDTFREEILAGGLDGEDAVEAFSLDPDFDYDNVQGLTSRVTEPERSAIKETLETSTAHRLERDDDAAEDSVLEP
eukprot:TRINITY_DN91961_c0_g1_i1.p1 TRINITY_DN91961_c0_g1~~TRINITY_DN91961_c0_g1_i1.p1  ORF type:complete len:265 (+),score=67.88 TRINITY_DN91961_c0_g1_i1:67-861(+)